MKYVVDVSGYAPGADEFSTFVVAVMGNFSPPPAALIDATEGATKSELFLPLIFPTPRLVVTAYWYSTYPIDPSVCWTAAATPDEPLPPVPFGHCTALSAPIF